MSSAGSLESLRQQRDQQLAKLRGHIQSLVESQKQTAAWVGAHPYVATLSAAAAGFFAARFTQPPAHEPPVEHLHRRRREPPICHNGDRRGRTRETSDNTGWVAVLFKLAEPLLASLMNPQGGRAAEFRTGDAGATSGKLFPGAFVANDARDHM